MFFVVVVVGCCVSSVSSVPPGISSGPKNATTPREANMRVVSILNMRACAFVLNTNAANNPPIE